MPKLDVLVKKNFDKLEAIAFKYGNNFIIFL